MARIAKWRDGRRDRCSGGTECAALKRALIPDLHSRYFTADFPYGLSVIQQIGCIAGVDMQNIESLLEWYDDIAVVNDRLYLSDFGISSMEDLRAFYLK